MRAFAQVAWDYIALLTLLNAAQSDRLVDNLKIQKLTFITETRALEAELKVSHYPFFRYNLGPFSKYLANDVRRLEENGFVDTETRSLTERGKYLIRYVTPEIRQSQNALRAFTIIDTVCNQFRVYRSSRLVDIVYDMSVPVFAFGNEIMKVRDIPMLTDILCPTESQGQEVGALSDEVVEDIKHELALTPADLNPQSEHIIESVTAALQRALIA
jgi:uncharacterized protein YwgA